jgi:hypothetical protein
MNSDSNLLLDKLGLLTVNELLVKFDHYLDLSDEEKESYPDIYSLEFYFQYRNKATDMQNQKFLKHIESFQIKNIKSIEIRKLFTILLSLAKIVLIYTKN